MSSSDNGGAGSRSLRRRHYAEQADDRADGAELIRHA
jgi:hypothetical protein